MLNIFYRAQHFIERFHHLFLSGRFTILQYPKELSNQEKRIQEFFDFSVLPQNVILTTYFNSKKDPQREIFTEGNDFNYIEKFYESVKQNNLFAIIFHDGLGSDFIQKYTCQNIIFLKCKILNFSLNDERFFIYREFLLQAKVSKIIMSDINDVIFEHDPFQMMNIQEFYIGKDINGLIKNNPWIMQKLNTFPDTIRNNYSFSFFHMPVVNAGVIGGKRDSILKFLNCLVFVLNQVNNNHNNNMAAVNIVFFDNYWAPFLSSFNTKKMLVRYKKFIEYVLRINVSTKVFLLGYPFTSQFKKYEQKNGAKIFHK